MGSRFHCCDVGTNKENFPSILFLLTLDHLFHCESVTFVLGKMVAVTGLALAGKGIKPFPFILPPYFLLRFFFSLNCAKCKVSSIDFW
jgi:hypothetical protein